MTQHELNKKILLALEAVARITWGLAQVRIWEMADNNSIPRGEPTLHSTLTDAQRSFPNNTVNIRRFKEDDPKIIEVWV